MSATPEYPGWMRVSVESYVFWVKLSDWMFGPDPSAGISTSAIDIWKTPLDEYPFNTVWRSAVTPLD